MKKNEETNTVCNCEMCSFYRKETIIDNDKIAEINENERIMNEVRRVIDEFIIKKMKK